METGDPTAAQKRTFWCSCLHPHQKLRTQDRERRKTGCWGQKIAVLQGLALITTSSPSSSSSYLGRRPASGQQPRWKVPLPRAGRGADNGGGIHYKGTHIHTRTHTQHCRLPHELGGPLKEAAAPSPLSEMLDTFPLSQPWWETDLEENASKALGCPRKGGLCAPRKPATSPCTTQRKSLLAYNSHPQKTLSFICN